jgi:chemotaxis signal transduction protein
MRSELNEQEIFERRALDLARVADNSRDRQIAWAGAVVMIGGERYGFPVAIVSRVVKCPKITKLPRGPSHLWGIAALRGEVLSVVDLATVLGARACTSASLLLVLTRTDAEFIGIPIESLLGLRTVYMDEMSTVAMPGTDDRGLVISRTKDFVSLIDAEKLFAAESLRFVWSQAK